MITAASTAVAVVPILKQTSATITTVAAVMIAVGRSRAAAGSGRCELGVRAGAGGRGATLARAARRAGTRRTLAPLGERFGEFGFLVDRARPRRAHRACSSLAAQVFGEVGFRPSRTALGPKARLAAADRRPRVEVVVDFVAVVVGEDRRHGSGRRFGPVRERRQLRRSARRCCDSGRFVPTLEVEPRSGLGAPRPSEREHCLRFLGSEDAHAFHGCRSACSSRRDRSQVLLPRAGSG